MCLFFTLWHAFTEMFVVGVELVVCEYCLKSVTGIKKVFSAYL